MCYSFLFFVSVFVIVRLSFFIGNSFLLFICDIKSLSRSSGFHRYLFPLSFLRRIFPGHARFCRTFPSLRHSRSSHCPSIPTGTAVTSASGSAPLQSGSQFPISPPSTSSQATTRIRPVDSSPICNISGSRTSSNSMRGLPICSASSIASLTISVMSRST